MEAFLAKHSLYVVLLVVLTIWIGIAVYLFRLERSLAKLEKSIAAKSPTQGGHDKGATIV